MALPKSGIPQQPCDGHGTELFVCLSVMHVWCFTCTIRLYMKIATESDGKRAGTVLYFVAIYNPGAVHVPPRIFIVEYWLSDQTGYATKL